MSAIEYGSYYWCVLLNGNEGDKLGNYSIHLHADEMSIDDNGNLVFKSVGRRPAGRNPNQQNGEHPSGEKDEKKEGKEQMTYFAVASGSWKVAYAAKLQDGSAASVEHWNDSEGRDALPPAIPLNAAARDYPPEV